MILECFLLMILNHILPSGCPRLLKPSWSSDLHQSTASRNFAFCHLKGKIANLTTLLM